MKILVALAFVAILVSLTFALLYMMRGSASDETRGSPPTKGRMASALAWRVGLSIALFLFILLSWHMGWIKPSGIPVGV